MYFTLVERQSRPDVTSGSRRRRCARPCASVCASRRWKRGEGPGLAKALEEIARRCAALPVVDDRTADEILGYDENGLPS